MGKCALCLKDLDLVKSHILPEFLYKPMYDDKHKYIIISTDSSKKPVTRPKGIYERLLCDNCDNNILGEYENYASKVLFHDGITKDNIKKIDIGFLITDIDYELFKLYQMSLLWRSSVSCRPEFKDTNLGPHSDRIREMLINRNPGKRHKYGCVIYYIPDQPEEMIEFIYPPELIPNKIEGHRWYRAIFNGRVWTYIVSSHSNMYSHQELFLQEDGTLPIINSGKFGKKFITSLAHDLNKSIRI